MNKSRNLRLKRRLGIFLGFIVLVALVMYLFHNSNSKSQTISQDLSEAIPTNTPIPTPQSTALAQVVSQALTGTHGNYAIVIKNLKTGEYFSQNGSEAFESGSLYKLWVMGESYRQIQSGTLSEDEVLSGDVEQLNQEFHIDPDDADLTAGTITISVKDALNQMITISHNYDALLLTQRLGLSNINNFLQINGYDQSQLGTDTSQPKTTAADIADFFEDLYGGKLANQQYTDEMLELLKNQQLNGKLPKYLPQGTVIAHKTGELDNFSHDAGIIYMPPEDGDYIIVVLSESDDPGLADERIAQVSQSVFDYFLKGGEGS